MKNRLIVVSGAANGIGAAICLKLIEIGAYPIGIDVKPLLGSELWRKSAGCWTPEIHFSFLQSDASDRRKISAFFKKMRIKKIHGLVNNAGFLGNDPSHGGRNVASFRKMMKAHAETALTLIELLAPLLEENGSIVNIGSIEIAMAAPDVVLYTAAKGTLYGMTVAYSTALAPKGIRVNMVSPGDVNTEKNIAQFRNKKAGKIIKGFRERTPLKRSVEPEEVADAVLFLLSERASAVTGQELVVDCGYTRALWDPSWTRNK